MSQKDAYYFSHDANARNDTKILSMRSIYGSEGYGWYWIIVEMLREQQNYKIELGKYVWNALAMQMQCTADAAQKYVEDCINEFNLFVSDGEFFWSESLIRRMKSKDEKSEKAKRAAEARWNKASNNKGSKHEQSTSNAPAMQTDSKRNANKVKESKVKESKVKESKVNKIKYAEFVSMTEEEYQKLVADHGEEATKKMIEKLDHYKGSSGKKYKSDYRAILSWVKDEVLSQKGGTVHAINSRDAEWINKNKHALNF